MAARVATGQLDVRNHEERLDRRNSSAPQARTGNAPEEAGEQVGDASAESRDIALSVQSAMAHVPEEQRMAIALVLIEGLSYKDAAEALGIPIGTLTSRLARGREALQRLLGDDGGSR